MTLKRLVSRGLIGSVAAVCLALGAEPKRVLLIHAFGRDFAPFGTISGIFRTELAAGASGTVAFFEVSLDSARLVEAPADEAALVDYLRARSAQHPVDLVVPLGGPAAQFAQRHRQRLFPNTPVLIGATDQRHLERTSLTPNDAAVTVAIDPVGTLETILQVLPETTNIVVAMGNSPLELFWQGEIRRQVAPLTNRVTFTWLNTLPLSEMVERCATLPSRSAIYLPILSVDAAGIPHLEDRALARLHAAANSPIFGIYDTQLGSGIVGGRLLAISELSRDTAQAAVRILRWESPGSIRVPPRAPGPPQFDWRELRRWGIAESRLPPGSVVHFREPTAWELYRGRIVAMLALCGVQAALIALLVGNLLRRRRAECALRESEERLSVAAAAANVGVWAWDIGRNRVWATSLWRALFGFAADAAVTYDAVLERVHPDDRARVDRSVRLAIEDRSDFVSEYRVVLSDGTERWIAARGRVETDDGGAVCRMLGASVDITARKRTEHAARELSGRLINAQEEERSRLARELHDDITQQLARLAIDLGRCELGTAKGSPAKTARETREALARLSEDVHALAYRLHPSVLEDLGLVEALRAETDRFALREQVAVGLKLTDTPATVPRAAALCLFRVAQEALHNVARHAVAQSVEVSLRSLDAGLQLAVRDDGRGFDATRPPDRPSLGLASMRERVHLLGGDLDVESAPGHGTTVVAWVPIPQDTD